MLRTSLALLGLLAACAPESSPDALLPADAVGTPGTMVMSISPIVPGAPVTFTVTNAAPNRTVFFVRSNQAQLNGFCPPALGGSCVDLRSPATLTFQRNANGQGVATITATVPSPLNAQQVAWQAVNTSPAFNSSNVITAPVYQPGSDTDGDGLTAFDEVTLYNTHPGEADTDGGGVNDGDEIAAGTDPTDPNDDVIGGVLGIDDIGPGDLLITEIMQNPFAVTDGDGEYFEIFNPGADPIDIQGMRISDDATNNHVVNTSAILAPGAYGVLTILADPTRNGGINPLYSYQGSNFVMSNTDDEVILNNAAGVIDRVAYDGGPSFPNPNGASMNLDPSAFDDIANDDGASWCSTPTAVFGPGDKGTPGLPNQACPPPVPTFDADIYPDISLARCAGCHTGGGASGGFNQDVYGNWLASSAQVPTMPRVTPGDTATSYVWHKIQGTQATVGGSGLRMPRNGPPYLDATQTDLVEAWILGGAPEN